jgi:NADH-quinone oxidoreductase subunit L
MTVPMIVLAVGSGLLGLVLAFTGFSGWLHPVFGGEEHAEHTNWTLMVITLLLVAGGVTLAWMRYWRDDVPTYAPAGNALTVAARNDLYQDALNEALFMRPGIRLTRALRSGDESVVDGVGVGGLAGLVGGASAAFRRVQNGYARSYALTMLAGVVAILGAVWVIN